MTEYVFWGLPKMRNYPRKAGLDWESKWYIRGKWVQDRWSTVFCLLLFSSAFFLICIPSHFSWTINYPKQAITLSDASQVIKVFWLFSTMTGQRQLSFSKQILYLSKKALSDWFATKKFFYKQVYLYYIQISCHFKTERKTAGGQ